ncbi:MAG: acyl-CoA carboxylase subunit epsilon [Jatrophihabitans sp.]|nr:MAG: acyl-CoA carboxylase subunit epsilon [Jatrophihabitans sp.]
MNPERPALRVVSGDPTPEELAVLTALVTAVAAAGGATAHPRERGGWADPARALRVPPPVGPGSWRNSLR